MLPTNLRKQDGIRFECDGSVCCEVLPQGKLMLLANNEIPNLDSIRRANPLVFQSSSWCFYWETNVISLSGSLFNITTTSSVVIGLVPIAGIKVSHNGMVPGFIPGSFGYFSTGVIMYDGKELSSPPNLPGFGVTSNVGFGYELSRNNIFITCNSLMVTIPDLDLDGSYIPAIGIMGKGATIYANFGSKPFIHNIPNNIVDVFSTGKKLVATDPAFVNPMIMLSSESLDNLSQIKKSITSNIEYDQPVESTEMLEKQEPWNSSDTSSGKRCVDLLNDFLSSVQDKNKRDSSSFRMSSSIFNSPTKTPKKIISDNMYAIVVRLQCLQKKLDYNMQYPLDEKFTSDLSVIHLQCKMESVLCRVSEKYDLPVPEVGAVTAVASIGQTETSTDELQFEEAEVSLTDIYT